MKRQIIIILITLSIFGANLFATANVFIKGDSHNNSCSLHKHQHTHNSLEHTHGHNHKVNSIDFYISESIQIEPLFYIKEDNFYFTEQYNYSISKELFRPPIV
ncbi:hypothetical protein [Sulfurimonas sp.]|uniref:hypothetical protein n=1 Tax=Sulfurimonas sp. TaxID=2022749 RepID=UPI001A07B4E1|nr:hypothetical protein [Sulfurimonas sp.]MBE0514014.1 hypothetical protein [Sulfurimonas sp.]